ncbi:MAG TPA: RluA family pseudouridine synthase [bacterium]|nr:RluA family pseudouridine synthase [bacterium]
MAKQLANQKREFVARTKDKGKRLDLFLAFYNNDWSRTFIKKQIEANRVTVNGDVEFKANYKVVPKDNVAIEPKLESSLDKIEPEDIDLDIVFEDDGLIIVNKPSGMTVHPATGNWQGTLMNALVGYFKGLENIGDKVRSGLIHRLDKNTSGLVMIAKTNEALWYYSKLFSDREVKKNYYAIVKGDASSLFGSKKKVTVRNYLGRNPKARKKFTEVEKGGKLAHTDFELTNIFGEGQRFTLIKASPKTGRTHQIRVHLASLGFPIVGDEWYGGEKGSRLMLHASSLKFVSLDKKTRKIDIGIPVDIVNFIYNKDQDIKIKDILKNVKRKKKPRVSRIKSGTRAKKKSKTPGSSPRSGKKKATKKKR